MSLRRLLAGLALLAGVLIAVVVLKGGGEDPEGTTERGLPGFPVRGSLANDTEAIDGAVAAWRKRIKKDEEEKNDDPDAEESARHARRPDPDDDIAVLWIGRVDHDDVAILESRGLAAEVTRDRGLNGWFVSGERLRYEDFGGEYPIDVGDSILTPDRGTWHYVNASFGSGYENTGDGLFQENGVSPGGFVLPERAVNGLVPIHIAGVGSCALREEDYAGFVKALERGYGRSIWLAVNEAENATDDDDGARERDDPPPLALVWTGAVPDYAHAAAVLQGASFSGPRVAALGYGETPGPEDRSEEKDEGAVKLGSAPGDRRNRVKDTFAAGTYTQFHDVPYLVLAGAGATETIHAFVGAEEVTRKAPLAVIDARRFASDDNLETVVFGRTAKGEVVAPLETR